MEAQVQQAEASLRLAETQADTKTWEKDIELAGSQVETARAVLTGGSSLRDREKLGSRNHVRENRPHTSTCCTEAGSETSKRCYNSRSDLRYYF